MPIRIPFTRKPGVPGHMPDEASPTPAEPDPYSGFERVETIGSKASSAPSLRSAKSQDNGEYKMSVFNDSGVYLPPADFEPHEQPSPTEDKAHWPRRYLASRMSTDTRSSFGDIEHFSISRESFDSYRRSFDVSACSPTTNHDVHARQSLDSPHSPQPPRSAINRNRGGHFVPAEDRFEDVGLDDQKQQAPRRRGFFYKFGEAHDKDTSSQTVPRFLIPGRRRAHSGQGAELAPIERRSSTDEDSGRK